MARPRIIVATPDPIECEVLAQWLADDGFEPLTRTTLAETADAIANQNFDLFVADFTFAFRYRLHAASRRRIRDLKTPTLVVGDLDVAGRVRAEDRRAMYLSRPVERAALLCLVSMAILDGRPVRRSPRLPIDALEVLVNGAPSRVLDLSPEGLRLEIPRDGRPAPPPVFAVSVPMFGVSVAVRRRWTRTRSGPKGTEPWHCGGLVSLDTVSQAMGWSVLLDTLPSLHGPLANFVQLETTERQ